MKIKSIKILLIEDNPADVRLIKEMLIKSSGGLFELEFVDRLSSGLEKLNSDYIDIVLLDLGLPDSQGIDTFKKVQAAASDLPIIVLTGLQDETIAIKAVREGAQDYLVKANMMHASLLVPALRYALERKKAQQEIFRGYEKLHKIMEETVNALASVLGKRDPFTHGHQMRVTQLACAIAKKMNLSVERINGLRLAGRLHDIGKISIPAEILTKPSKLTDAEYRIVKTHSQHAYDVLKDIEFPWPIADIVLQHHERLDGSGYPRGLKDKEILLEAKIIAVADVVEAMSSHRPYRPALGIDKALNEIETNKGRFYDSKVVDICLDLFKNKGFTFTQDRSE